MKFKASFRNIYGDQQISVEALHIAHALYEISCKGHWVNWVHQMVDTIAVDTIEYFSGVVVKYKFSDNSSLWYIQVTGKYYI